MTIKELAFVAQQHLETVAGGSLKRAHVYELFASAFGFHSHAAFGVDTVFTTLRPNDKRMLPQRTSIVRRCIELGYEPARSLLVATSLESFLTQRQIGVASISSLVRYLQGEMPNPDGYFADEAHNLYGEDLDDPIDLDDNGEFGQIIAGSLEAAASKGNALAHYALALINDPHNEYDDADAGSAYWYARRQEGHMLTGVEREWADAYEVGLTQAEKYLRHLREAARLGHQDALLDLADQFDDPAFFEQSRGDVGSDPAVVAAIAARLGRSADAKHWFTIAAESGDTEAMLELIEEYDRDDLARCWMWVYLSQLVGNDLTKSAYYAVNDDGSEYDDDVGGPVYAAGRDGVNLDRLNAEQDGAAKMAAEEIFRRIGEMVT